MRPRSRARLLALCAPPTAFLVVFAVSLAVFRLGDEAGPQAAPSSTTEEAPPSLGRLVVTLKADSTEPVEGYLASVSLEGSDVRPITTSPESGLAADGSPSVSPDGTTVAFQRAVPGEPPFVHLVGIDGSGLRRLTRGRAAEISPAWSPDGTRIAFSRAVGDRFDLFVADADGSHLAQVTRTANADEDGAAWSPNGAQLAFARFANDDENLWVVDVDGANAHALIRGPHEDSSPAWAADGARIAIVRDGRIALFSFEHFEVTMLTDADPGKDAGPNWSPDGSRIVFTRDPGTIFVMDADSASQTRVPLPGRATGAVWEPGA